MPSNHALEILRKQRTKKLRENATKFAGMSKIEQPTQQLENFIAFYLEYPRPNTFAAETLQRNAAAMITPLVATHQQDTEFRSFVQEYLGNMPIWVHYTAHFGTEFLSPITGTPDPPVNFFRQVQESTGTTTIPKSGQNTELAQSPSGHRCNVHHRRPTVTNNSTLQYNNQYCSCHSTKQHTLTTKSNTKMLTQ